MRIVRSCGASTIAAYLRMTRQELFLAEASGDHLDTNIDSEEPETDVLEAFSEGYAMSSSK
ncbi:hypothetical protein Lepto7376_3188 [[Leptolyngbya] sp. PCC 7376]|uniref:hypothetical protein n=1 Tax=[Leptolyngbya] sp. PCC 7376 TaxID=111781 RepID=UPI00029F2DEC|nr:hypothetical protein [[Leptolyngbya] sp. PCC 7376]AFY39417.1 hypothetical protein Lepto7376_3188 [[Leptolyngbya] sp. PCC 7376]